MDWRPLEAGYRCFICDLDALMSNRSTGWARVYNHILEQSRYMIGGRDLRTRGIMAERRDVTGRHGPRRRAMTSSAGRTNMSASQNKTQSYRRSTARSRYSCCSTNEEKKEQFRPNQKAMRKVRWHKYAKKNSWFCK